MQVNGINSSMSFSGKAQLKSNKMASNVAFEGDKNNNNVSNRALTNATKALALSILMSMGTAGLGGCDKLDINETHVYPVEIPTDTVYEHHYFPIPGENTVDTVKIKPGYDSPVAPVIKDFFEDNDIDTGDGRIPVRITYLDEYKHPKVKALFNEQRSSTKEMWYNVTTTDYDEDAGDYVEGKNQNYFQIGYSSPDEKNQLVVKLMKLRNPDMDKNNELNYESISTALYDVSTMKRYTVDEDGNATYDGHFEKGDVPNSIMFVNSFGAKTRYANVAVNSVTPEDTVIKDEDDE